jgi:hypothetical protein
MKTGDKSSTLKWIRRKEEKDAAVKKGLLHLDKELLCISYIDI